MAKVIGISKLKGKYEPFEAKRQLCNSYDLFVADDRIVPSLPKLIGTLHFKKAQVICRESMLADIACASTLRPNIPPAL